MKKQILIFLVLLSVTVSVSAQSEEARKIDEFGNINCDDYLSRMDNFMIELNNAPNTKGYVFVYEGKLTRAIYDKDGKYVKEKYVSPRIGEAKARIKTMKRQLLFRKYPVENIVFIEAGFRENYAVEFWIVPNNVNPPKPSLTLKKIEHRKGKPQSFCNDF